MAFMYFVISSLILTGGGQKFRNLASIFDHMENERVTGKKKVLFYHFLCVFASYGNSST